MVERLLSLRSRRFLLLFLVVMLAFGPVMRAYADDYEGGGGASSSFNNNFGTVWYGPTGTGGIANTLYVRYGVVANTQYDAALYCCRGSNFDLTDLTPTQKSKLLANADFYQFANLFKVGKPEETSDWRGDANVVFAWNTARQMYGETYCYSALYTNDQKIRAQDAINRIMAESGGPSGGGPGPGNVESEQYVLIRVYEFAPNAPYDIDYLAIKKSAFVDMSNFAEEKEEILLATVGKTGHEGRVVTIPEDKFEFLGADGQRAYCIKWLGTFESKYVVGTANIGEIDGKKCAILDSNVSSNNNFGGNGQLDGSYPVYYRSYTDEVTEPPVTWPDPPTTPPYDPPEVPGPGDPIVPTPPDPPTPWEPIPGIDIDITGDDFQDLLDALNEHCIHLQTSIQENISQLWGLQSDLIESQIGWLGNDVIIDSFTDLKDYLNELFEWLADQMQFDVNVEGGQYDDTSVIYWLKQIWAKLPTGINTRPTDPVTNPTGWWDWLTQLLNNLAADLMALGHDRLANLLEMLNQLRNKFPFSLPWDIAALLGLLVAVPECPEFDVPAYSLGSDMELAEVGTYHITLEPYTQVWEGVKWIETLAFAVYLITHTGGLMDMVTKTVRPR